MGGHWNPAGGYLPQSLTSTCREMGTRRLMRFGALILMAVQRHIAASKSTSPWSNGQHFSLALSPRPMWIKPPRTSTHALSLRALMGQVFCCFGGGGYLTFGGVGGYFPTGGGVCFSFGGGGGFTTGGGGVLGFTFGGGGFTSGGGGVVFTFGGGGGFTAGGGGVGFTFGGGGGGLGLGEWGGGGQFGEEGGGGVGLEQSQAKEESKAPEFRRTIKKLVNWYLPIMK